MSLRDCVSNLGNHISLYRRTNLLTMKNKSIQKNDNAKNLSGSLKTYLQVW
ncbi:MAG: hypothetical protein IJM09_06490 [Neisseriaceae bacterium]|nr:hypothetical protein [Neisseriaceae bacterium]